MGKVNAVITGVGGYVPDYVLTNDELSRMVDTSDEWIMTRVGIKERHILTEEGLGTSYMARKAANELLKKTGADPDSIGALIVCTTTPDYKFPSTASIVLGKLGLKNAFAFDMECACCGFLYGLDMASSMIQSGRYKRIVVIGADKMSTLIDYTDRQTCVLFGDGAGAMVLGKGDNYLASKLTSTPMPDVIYYRLPCEPTPFETGEGIDTHMAMQLKGREVFRMAVTSAQRDIRDVVEKAGLKLEDIDHFLLHQANMRIVDAIKQNFDLPQERFLHNIEYRGNTSSASIPILLDEKVREGAIKRGDLMVFNGFGAGFVTSAAVMRY